MNNEGKMQFAPKLGVCTRTKNHNILQVAGYDYIEESVQKFLVPQKNEKEFESKYKDYKKSKLPVYACNSFLPGSMKCVGPKVNHEAILKYAETAFRRAQIVGVKTVVFGSGASRKIPDDFSPKQAKIQFINLLKKMGPIAEKYHVVISIEPLRSKECNFINRVSEGCEIAKKVNHPNIRVLADIYHMTQESEGPDSIIKAGEYLYHCHIAEKKKRTPPGVAGDDFKPYLKALKQIRYQGGISVECSWKDFSKEAPIAIEVLKKQIDQLE